MATVITTHAENSRLRQCWKGGTIVSEAREKWSKRYHKISSTPQSQFYTSAKRKIDWTLRTCSLTCSTLLCPGLEGRWRDTRYLFWWGCSSDLSLFLVSVSLEGSKQEKSWHLFSVLGHQWSWQQSWGEWTENSGFQCWRREKWRFCNKGKYVDKGTYIDPLVIVFEIYNPP